MGKRSGTAANAAAVALLGVAVCAIPLLARTANAVPFTFETVALSGDVAPGTDGATFTTRFRQPVLNASGNTAFYAELADAGLANQGIWKEGASLDLVVRRGDAAPGAAGTTFSRFSSSPAINDSGNTAFTARIAGATVTSSDDTGIWKEGVSIDLVVREGDVAPGTGGATFLGNFDSFGLSVALNDSGNTAFRGFLTGTTGTNAGIFKEAGASIGLVARKGDAAPDIAGATFSSFGAPGLGDSGNTAFVSFLSGAGANDSTIWKEAGASIDLLAREGDAAPGTAGATFASLFSPVLLNDSDNAAFAAAVGGVGVTNDNNKGIWNEGTSLDLVARTGDIAPGTGGATFQNIEQFSFNDFGNTAFRGVLTIGGGVTFDNHTGIWTEGSALDLVIRAGDILEVNPGDFRTLSAVSLAGTGGALNNNNQLAFLGAFTDGSRGIFRASKVPEPAALALFALGLTGLGLIARHRRRAAYLSSHW